MKTKQKIAKSAQSQGERAISQINKKIQGNK